MLASVVGVGIHWLEPTMCMLHVQCMVGTNYAHVTCSVYDKIFRFAALLGIVLDL